MGAAAGDRGSVLDCFQTLERVKRANVQPDPRAYTLCAAAIAGLARHGRAALRAAETLLQVVPSVNLEAGFFEHMVEIVLASIPRLDGPPHRPGPPRRGLAEALAVLACTLRRLRAAPIAPSGRLVAAVSTAAASTCDEGVAQSAWDLFVDFSRTSDVDAGLGGAVLCGVCGGSGNLSNALHLIDMLGSSRALSLQLFRQGMLAAHTATMVQALSRAMRTHGIVGDETTDRLAREADEALRRGETFVPRRRRRTRAGPAGLRVPRCRPALLARVVWCLVVLRLGLLPLAGQPAMAAARASLSLVSSAASAGRLLLLSSPSAAARSLTLLPALTRQLPRTVAGGVLQFPRLVAAALQRLRFSAPPPGGRPGGGRPAAPRGAPGPPPGLPGPGATGTPEALVDRIGWVSDKDFD